MQAYIVRAATPLHGHIKTHLKTIQFFHFMMIIQKTKYFYKAWHDRNWIKTKDSKKNHYSVWYCTFAKMAGIVSKGRFKSWFREPQLLLPP